MLTDHRLRFGRTTVRRSVRIRIADAAWGCRIMTLTRINKQLARSRGSKCVTREHVAAMQMHRPLAQISVYKIVLSKQSRCASGSSEPSQLGQCSSDLGFLYSGLVAMFLAAYNACWYHEVVCSKI